MEKLVFYATNSVLAEPEYSSQFAIVDAVNNGHVFIFTDLFFYTVALLRIIMHLQI